MRLGRHTVYEQWQDIPDCSVDMVAADPPWNQTSIKFDKSGFNNDGLAAWLQKHVKVNGWTAVFCPFEVAILFNQYFRNKFTYVWDKRTGIYRPSNIRPVMVHELIWMFIRRDLKRVSDLYIDKKKLRTPGDPYVRSHENDRYDSEYAKSHGLERPVGDTVNDGYREGVSILRFHAKNQMRYSERTDHPTQKPVALLQYLIEGYCPPGGTVLDPTLGSGTTLMACELTGRTCIGAEINPEYRSIIKGRFDRTLGGWQ